MCVSERRDNDLANLIHNLCIRCRVWLIKIRDIDTSLAQNAKQQVEALGRCKSFEFDMSLISQESGICFDKRLHILIVPRQDDNNLTAKWLMLEHGH